MGDGNLEYREGLSLTREGEFGPTEIKRATLQQIQEQIDNAYQFAATAETGEYRRGRGAKKLLMPGENYAELPSLGNKPPREIIQDLPPGSTILDVGCGYGQLGAEILGVAKPSSFDQEIIGYEEGSTLPINSGVSVFGFDAQAQEGQERLTKIVIGNIDDLSLLTFVEDTEGFDLVLSSSLLYHLPDYWGGILRMARVLKPEGVILASTLPRVIEPYANKSAENSKGFLTIEDNALMRYSRNRNVFDISGRLIPPGEVIKIINNDNEDQFHLEYGVASAQMGGTVTHGGQISGQRLSSEGNLDLSCMFYCLYEGDLGYILAKTSEEKEILKKRGYVNLHDRLKTK